QGFKTTGTSTWLGVDAFSPDPGDVTWDQSQLLGQPQLSPSGPYFYISSDTRPYVDTQTTIDTTAPDIYEVKSWTESTWYGKKTYYQTWVREQNKQDINAQTLLAS